MQQNETKMRPPLNISLNKNETPIEYFPQYMQGGLVFLILNIWLSCDTKRVNNNVQTGMLMGVCFWP